MTSMEIAPDGDDGYHRYREQRQRDVVHIVECTADYRDGRMGEREQMDENIYAKPSFFHDPNVD